MKAKLALILACVAVAQPVTASIAKPPTTEQAQANLASQGPIENFTLSQLADGIDDGELNSEAITAAYLARIAAIDDAGPMLNAVIATFPDALDQARAMDAELKAGKYRGTMHGMPVLVKDNIEVAGSIATTAGSLALAGNVTNRDAPLIARLREAGAVILGKTNLSEWANIRSDNSTSGWSAVGGLTKNPHVLDRNACGSSSGSGAATAAGLAAGTIGTETDGSIACPAGINGIVGFKPTVGLVSRRFVVPISHSQDTAGPMTRSVRDAAIMLTAMAGSDPEDPATAEADKWRGNYAAEREKETLLFLARAGEFRDEETGNHLARMARYSRIVANCIGLEREEAETIELAAPLHDIGKIGTPDHILLKPGKHSDDEQRVMRQHALIGHEILKGSASKYVRMGALIALGHHEKYDGTGYPSGLDGDHIPLAARIVAVADVYDALTSVRPYKHAWGAEEAFDYLRGQRGRHFDPRLVDAFLSMRPDVLRVQEQLRDPAGAGAGR